MSDLSLPTTKGPKSAGLLNRYRHLSARHAAMEQSLASELKRPLPDSTAVQRLKRHKLRVKDELASIERLFAAIGTSIGKAIPSAV